VKCVLGIAIVSPPLIGY